MVYEGTQELKKDQQEKVKALEQDLNIKKSKKINGARLREMKERNDCLMKIKETMKERLQAERTNNRQRYLNTLKELIKQSMIKLLEPELIIQCRDEDKDEIQDVLETLQDEYTSYMLEKTEKDDYVCELSIMEDAALTDERDLGCGGVILYSADQKIVCPNMLCSRLDLAFEEMLP